MDEIVITVHGIPGPQGSKRFMGMRGGKGILVESSKKVKPWREAIKSAALDAMEDAELSVGRHCNGGMPGAIVTEMTFTMPRPKSAKKGARADRRPDLSKLIRSTEDALTDIGAWEDDARIVECIARKVFPGEHVDSLLVPGAIIRIRSAIGARTSEANSQAKV